MTMMMKNMMMNMTHLRLNTKATTATAAAGIENNNDNNNDNTPNKKRRSTATLPSSRSRSRSTRSRSIWYYYYYYCGISIITLMTMVFHYHRYTWKNLNYYYLDPTTTTTTTTTASQQSSSSSSFILVPDKAIRVTKTTTTTTTTTSSSSSVRRRPSSRSSSIGISSSNNSSNNKKIAPRYVLYLPKKDSSTVQDRHGDDDQDEQFQEYPPLSSSVVVVVQLPPPSSTTMKLPPKIGGGRGGRGRTRRSRRRKQERQRRNNNNNNNEKRHTGERRNEQDYYQYEPDYGTIKFRSLYPSKIENEDEDEDESNMINNNNDDDDRNDDRNDENRVRHHQQQQQQFLSLQQRKIRPMKIDFQEFEYSRQRSLEIMDLQPYKEQFDFREDLIAADLEEEEDEDEDEDCRDPAWVDDFLSPTCNTIHEIFSTLDRPPPIPITPKNPSSSSSSSSSVITSQQQQLQDYDFKYLSAGGLRVAWRASRSSMVPSSSSSSSSKSPLPPPHSNKSWWESGDDVDNKDDAVVKLYKLSDKSHYQSTLGRVRLEALVMERLSPSPYILDMYGLCGTTMVVEAMTENVENLAVPGDDDGMMDQRKLDELSEFWPHRQSQNNLTASEKLYLATSMAHGLYDLHYHDGGQILHADVALEQWLLSSTGQVKLNDFNYAEIMAWNVHHHDDGGEGGYCPSEVRYSGLIRSPEELTGDPSDSSKDVFSFGHVIYQLLTGLVPFYDEQFHGKDKHDLKPLILKGVRPYVDKRYLDPSSGVGYIEFHLAKIMMDCWKHDQNRRPTIATVLDSLRKTMIEAKKRGDLEPSDRIRTPVIVS